MRKLIFIFLFFFMTSVLWAMPPMPGSGHTHDGSLRQDQNQEIVTAEEPLLLRSATAERSSKSSSVSTTGVKKILIILAKFPNLSFNYDITAKTHDDAYYASLMGNWEEIPSDLTMAQYFKQMSQGN